MTFVLPPLSHINGHRLSVGSIGGIPMYRLLNGVTADILYCDPPWDDSHMKSFATMARKQTGLPTAVIPWARFMDELVRVIQEHVDGWVFVESGVPRAHAVHAYLESAGLFDLGVHTTTYRSGQSTRPSALLAGHSRLGQAVGWSLPPGGGSGGLRQVLAVVGSVATPGQILLDPCCGTGLSARAAVRLGLTFYGNELNAYRAHRTAEHLRPHD